MAENARLNLISDKTFFKHIAKRKTVVPMILVLFIAVICIIGGTKSKGEQEESDDSLEKRVSDLCASIDGVGNCRVMIYYQKASSRYDEQKVESVVVICEGGDSVKVKKCLTEMLSSFFGIGSNRVKVEKMKK